MVADAAVADIEALRGQGWSWTAPESGAEVHDLCRATEYGNFLARVSAANLNCGGEWSVTYWVASNPVRSEGNPDRDTRPMAAGSVAEAARQAWRIAQERERALQAESILSGGLVGVASVQARQRWLAARHPKASQNMVVWFAFAYQVSHPREFLTVPQLRERLVMPHVSACHLRNGVRAGRAYLAEFGITPSRSANR